MLKKINIIILSLTLGLVLGQSTSQIQKVKELVKKGVVSEQQVRDAAKKRGISDSEINSMIKKEQQKKNPMVSTDSTPLKKLKTFENSNNDESRNISNSFLDESDVLDGKSDIEKESEALKNIDDREVFFGKGIESVSANLSFFGYDIFSRDPELFQASSSGAVDPDYLIAPGDEIIVMLWGETQFRLELGVDREGFVFIPEIGKVFVNGLNLKLLESKLFKVFLNLTQV